MEVWPSSKLNWSKISQAEETHQNSCVALNEFHKNLENLLLCLCSFEVCVTCSICLLQKKTETIYTTHITPLISQSSWTISSKALTNQMKVSSQTGREKIKQARGGREKIKSWLDNIKWHFISCWVQFKKKKGKTKQLMILPACRRVFLTSQ